MVATAELPKTDFWDNLLASGLLKKPQCDEVKRRLAQGAGDEVAADLIKQGWLTRYQVEQLRQGVRLVLGQYHILEELGRGGFGCVYKARHRLMDRLVALKVISPELVDNPRARNNFRREVLATTRLQHPSIVMAYDANEVDNTLFFVMEYVEGLNLQQLIKKHGPLSIRLACELMVQVSLALQCAHEHGLVHRDIKPPNLLIPRGSLTRSDAQIDDMAPKTGPGQTLVKVVDFGLAHLHLPSSGAVSTSLRTEHGFLGTPDFVSPEQARNSQDVDIRSDLYSLGCTFYFALTGMPPFRGGTVLETIVQHLEKTAVPVEEFRPEIPPLLGSLLRRLMAKNPDKRFQTPAELCAEVRFFLGSNAAGNFPHPVTNPEKPIPSRPGTAAKAQESSMSISLAMPATIQSRSVSSQVCPPRPPSSGNLGSSADITLQTAIRVNFPDAGPISPTGSAASIDVQQPTVNTPTVIPEIKNASKQTQAEKWREVNNLWRQWLAVLDGSGRLNEEDYRLVHTALVAALSNQAVSATNINKDLWDRLLTLVRPWLRLAALAHTDAVTRRELQTKCRELGKQLNLRDGGFHAWIAWGALFLLAVSGGIVCAVLR